MSRLLNQTCSNEDMLPKYTYIKQLAYPLYMYTLKQYTLYTIHENKDGMNVSCLRYDLLIIQKILTSNFCLLIKY